MSEEQFGVTIRTKRIRAAHRGAVTRLINQLEDSLTSAQLKQLKQSLLGKLDILSKLDGELLLHVEEEQLENEIEHADRVREKAELAIIHIEEELTKLARPIKSKRRSRTPVSTTSDTGDESDRSCQHQTVASETDSPRHKAVTEATTSEPFSLSRTSWDFSFKKSVPTPPTYTLAQAHGECVPNVSSICTANTMMNTHVVSSAYNTNVSSNSVQYSKPCGVSFAHGTIDSPLVKDTYASELRTLSNETRYLPRYVVDVPNETSVTRGPPLPLIDPVSTAHETRFLRGHH